MKKTIIFFSGIVMIVPIFYAFVAISAFFMAEDGYKYLVLKDVFDKESNIKEYKCVNSVFHINLYHVFYAREFARRSDLGLLYRQYHFGLFDGGKYYYWSFTRFGFVEVPKDNLLQFFEKPGDGCTL